MKKALCFLACALLFVAFVRVAFGNTPFVSSREVLKVLEEDGDFLSANEVFVDIQVIGYQFENIRNYLEADWGATYTFYSVLETQPNYNMADVVYDTNGEAISFVTRQTRIKPSFNDGFLDAILNVGQLIFDLFDQIFQFILLTFRTLTDVFLTILQALSGIAKIMYRLFFARA